MSVRTLVNKRGRENRSIKNDKAKEKEKKEWRKPNMDRGPKDGEII